MPSPWKSCECLSKYDPDRRGVDPSKLLIPFERAALTPAPIDDETPRRNTTDVDLQSGCRNGGGAHAPPLPNFQTGMPSLRALSARFSRMPVPGKTMAPIGSTSSI